MQAETILCVSCHKTGALEPCEECKECERYAGEQRIGANAVAILCRGFWLYSFPVSPDREYSAYQFAKTEEGK